VATIAARTGSGGWLRGDDSLGGKEGAPGAYRAEVTTAEVGFSIPTACYVLPMLGCSCVITGLVLLLNRADAERGLGSRGKWAIGLFVCGGVFIMAGPVSFLLS